MESRACVTIMAGKLHPLHLSESIMPAHQLTPFLRLQYNIPRTKLGNTTTTRAHHELSSNQDICIRVEVVLIQRMRL